ncbi:MAG TPA: type II toxin-antitoxin system CcdA family antitoxin [Pseudonocardiaceae bacterium]|jgi:Arc/MetJ family transcription regulator|nr:type II toxin-antitoxin system CcdA family antitoxin [Pseudonocardiaceae bacterium]
MAIAKVSVSIDADLLAEARELAGRRGLSALINDALRVRLQHARVSRLLDEMDEEFGPVPAEIEEEVRREWLQAGRFPSA